MENNKKCLGILVMVLVFSLMIVGCGGDDNKDINLLDTLNLSNTTPSNTELSETGLTLTQYNTIKNAAGGGFKGWSIDDYDGELTMAWTGCSVSNFNDVADILDDLFGEEGRYNESSIYEAEADNYYLILYSAKLTQGNSYVNQGTMVLNIYTD